MIQLRPAHERGFTHTPWLEGKHTFNFGDYSDPAHTGFGALKVINEDKIQPITGFDTHPHRNMEIITYILEGELEHKDSLGTSSIIRQGDVQRMSAGTGIRHSELNPHPHNLVHLLQIWITPHQQGLPPSYEQKNFAEERKPGKLTLLASQDGHENSLRIHQDVSLYVLDLTPGQLAYYTLAPTRMAWVQMARGQAWVNSQGLSQGDGAAITGESMLGFTAQSTAEILIFEQVLSSGLG